jgi:integrase
MFLLGSVGCNRGLRGRHVMETLGPQREGWTGRKAEAELRERLVRVEKEGLRRPAPLTFFRGGTESRLTAADVEGDVRAFHDLRHTTITHDAASGSSAIAVMAKAGHRNMATTRTYLHLAGTVFRDEAARLEERLRRVCAPRDWTRLPEKRIIPQVCGNLGR